MTRALEVWPITVGLLVDLGGSTLFGIGYAIVRAVLYGNASGEGLKQVVSTTTDLVVAAIAGLLFVVLGGYAAARMARARSMAHGACVGLGTLVVSLVVMWLAPDPSTPLWFSAVSVLGVVPAGSLGGYLRGSKLSSNTPLQPTGGGKF